LSLTHTALRETAIIEDDKLRVRFLRAIEQGRLKQNAVREVYPEDIQAVKKMDK